MDVPQMRSKSSCIRLPVLSSSCRNCLMIAIPCKTQQYLYNCFLSQIEPHITICPEQQITLNAIIKMRCLHLPTSRRYVRVTFMPPPSMDKMRTPLPTIAGRPTAILTASFSPACHSQLRHCSLRSFKPSTVKGSTLRTRMNSEGHNL